MEKNRGERQRFERMKWDLRKKREEMKWESRVTREG